ncbi:MAG TPA: proton-conducting transporter membrane subunit, partial [Bacillota bacterium]|nr:proton-conducting transporter membrane subunit [Bacillota bacterium]
MSSIEYLILFLIGSGIVAYLLTKWKTSVGSIFTIFATMFVFVSLAAYGFDLNLDTTVNFMPGFSFANTYLGFYFAIIITFVYLMVSFFHPYYLNEYKYKDSYNLLFLMSLAGIIGAFYTNNFLNLFFFFELIIWTTMFLIPQGKSREAAVSYFGFSVAGSVAMLLGIFVIYNASGTMDIAAGLAGVSGTSAIFAFVLFLIAAFAKLGAFPLHIWLPIAHGNAPHPFSPVLSGALVKLGAFIGILALVRIAPAAGRIPVMDLPIGQYIVAILGSLSIVFGTLMAIREDDAKKLLAYSSMSHGGYILVAFSIFTDAAT